MRTPEPSRTDRIVRTIANGADALAGTDAAVTTYETSANAAPHGRVAAVAGALLGAAAGVASHAANTAASAALSVIDRFSSML